MIDKDIWMPAFAGKLFDLFDNRLLFMGLQGSYRRGEAHAGSDIDVVTVLDRLDVSDLDAYRAAVAAMPEGEKACGFIGGRAELRHWPRHELFQLKMDTRAYIGSLEELLPPISREDIQRSAHIGASGIYHMLCHTYLYGDAAERPSALRAACKSAFFVLQTLQYLRTGVYPPTKRELLPLLDDVDREILAAGMAERESENSPGFRQLISWCARTLEETA